MNLKHFSLRGRIFLILTSLVLITLAGGSVTMIFLYRISNSLRSVIDTNLVALNAAQELENSLAMQKGFLTYYFMDSASEWLEQLNRNRIIFEDWLRKARESAYTETQRGILNEIESKYIRYSHLRDQVIELYRSGERESGFKLHMEIRGQFLNIRALCEQYKEIHAQSIAEARSDIQDRVRSLNILALIAMPGAVILAAILVYILLNQVLEPVRRLAVGAGPAGGTRIKDEVKELSRRVHNLMEDVDQTQTQLQQSREHLVQSEKLALVGKLAAGVAHSVRNPLTSVKMRLFSLERSLDLTPTQREDMEVISEEVRNIDTIVRNFLEFSRPPKLKLQNVSPSDVVDMAIQLLKHRLEAYGVEVELYRHRKLPQIEGDPEQLKEVFVNLIVNACDAMGENGKITIREEEGFSEPMGRVTVIKVTDNGPGVPESIREKVFQPFFSTKEEGTGLGLSIAMRIIEDHKGCLSLRTKEGKGATFIITLPCREDGAWLRSSL